MSGWFSGPKPPDPVQTAAAQTQSNINTAQANSVIGNADTYGPTGSQTWTQAGTIKVGNQTVPRWQSHTTLSPEQQRLYDQQTALQERANAGAGLAMDRVTGALGRPMNGNLPAAAANPGAGGGLGRVGQAPGQDMLGAGPQYSEVGGGPQMGELGRAQTMSEMGRDDYEQSRKRVEDAIYSRVNPQIEQDRNALASKLRNQGLVEGSPAFERAMDQSNRQANDMRMQAVLAGGGEQSRLFGMDQSRLGFNNNVRQTNFDNAATRTGFNNSARQQGYQNQLAGAGFNNAVRAQGFGDQATRAGFNNQARNQQYAYNREATGLNNAAQQTELSNRYQSADYQNSLRAQALNENYTAANQPINQFSALMGQGQVSQPQFQAYRGGQVAGTDIQGLIQQNYAQQSQNHNALIGAVAGVAGAGLGAYTGGLGKPKPPAA